jgi:hypothetical protein
MMNRLVWSVGLYTIDIVCYDEDNGVAKSILDMPPIFSNGDVRSFVKNNYTFDSYMEKGRFQVYAGLASSNLDVVSEVIDGIAHEFGVKPCQISNVEDLLSGEKNLQRLMQDFLNNQ